MRITTPQKNGQNTPDCYGVIKLGYNTTMHKFISFITDEFTLFVLSIGSVILYVCVYYAVYFFA
jgi:hypothetical protein